MNVVARSESDEAIQTFLEYLDCFAYARNDDRGCLTIELDLARPCAAAAQRDQRRHKLIDNV
jgi:hypothetical protein